MLDPIVGLGVLRSVPGVKDMLNHFIRKCESV